MKSRFYICEICGNIMGLIHDSGVPVVCCGQHMTEMEANTHEGSHEKHLPVVQVVQDKVIVSVGSTLHPMAEEHYIEWIYLETEKGGQRKALKPTQNPVVEFSVVHDKAIAIYAYCNIHGLWATKLN